MVQIIAAFLAGFSGARNRRQNKDSKNKEMPLIHPGVFTSAKAEPDATK